MVIDQYLMLLWLAIKLNVSVNQILKLNKVFEFLLTYKEMRHEF